MGLLYNTMDDNSLWGCVTSLIVKGEGEGVEFIRQLIVLVLRTLTWDHKALCSSKMIATKVRPSSP